MQPLRLLLVATVMVAVLALVAGFAATSDQVGRQGSTTGTAEVTPAAPTEELTATVPARRPIEMRVGDTVTLNVLLPEDDTLEIPAFGFEETVAARVRTPLDVTAVATGRYRIRLQDSGRTVGEIVVRRARTGTAPAPATPDRETPDEPAPVVGTPS